MRRAPVRRELDEDKEKRQYQARFEPELWERMVRYKEETGMNYMEQIARALDQFHRVHGVSEAPTGTIALDLPSDTIERLEKLAPQLHARNAAAYAEWLLNASSDKTKKQVLAFVFSELADESANGESDNNHTDSGNAPSPKTKQARKVA